jgi:hypothetical protein
MFYQMEKVYGEYCKNHDAAVGRLAKLESNKGIAIWLSVCFPILLVRCVHPIEWVLIT